MTIGTDDLLANDDTGNDVDPLIFGFSFNEAGEAAPLVWSQIGKKRHEGAPRIWVHLNRESLKAQDWLRKRSGIDPILVESLLQEDTRPRALHIGKGFLINLRGFNMNPGDALDDMVSVRMWADAKMLVTLRSRPLQASMDVRRKVELGEAPNSTGGLVTMIAASLIDRMEPEVGELEDQADDYEDKFLDPKEKIARSSLGDFRRKVLGVRRYILPQRDALAQLIREGATANFFNEHDLLRLREAADRVMRMSEELDTIRERTSVLQEQIMEERSEDMGQRLFILSMVSAIFLPISFVTGLFGVNIDGMPGMSDPWAFTKLVVALFLVTGLMLLVFRWRKWI